MTTMISALAALLLLSQTGLHSIAAAQDAPYPFFRRLDEQQRAQVRSSSSVPTEPVVPVQPQPLIPETVVTPTPTTLPQLTGEKKIGACLHADMDDAFPGEIVTYTLCIRSFHNAEMPAFHMAFFFDQDAMQITHAGGASGRGTHLAWPVQGLQPGEVRKFQVKVRILKNTKPGEKLQTYASMLWNGAVQPACAKHDLAVIEEPPKTGVENGTRPVEDRDKYLRAM